MYSIGQLARKTGVKITTIRYYEKIGLLDEPYRNQGNQRIYEKEGLERLSFIRHARELGLSIEDIRELIKLGNHPEESCAQAHKIADKQLQLVKNRLKKLKKLEKELKRIAAMSDEGQVGKCKIIASLADHSLCSGEH